MKKHRFVIILMVLFFALRLLWLRENLFFGFEQGRDFLKLSEIVSGDPVFIGPKTDIDGVFHGALSYYILVPPFIIFGGNPYLVLISLIFVHVLSAYFLFEFVKKSANKNLAYITVFLYAISYSSIVYSRWLSNPNLVPALVILILYFLQKAEKNNNNLIFVALFWSVIVHLQVVAALILVLPIAYFVFVKKLLTTRNLVLSAITVLLLLSSYILFNFKNDNILFNGVRNYITSGTKTTEPKLDEFYNETVDNFFPEDRELAYLLFWFVLIINLWDSRKNQHSRFSLVLYFSAPLLFLILKVTPLRHLFMLNSLFVSLLVGRAIFVLFKNKQLALASLVLVLFSFGNISAIVKRLPGSNRNFIYHAQSTYLYDELKILDYIYKEADGQKFSYDYYTVPYWQPQAWQYLFMWYGNRKYEYIPETNRTNVYFVVFEPDETQPEFQKNWYRSLNEVSTMLSESKSGKLKVEKRQEK